MESKEQIMFLLSLPDAPMVLSVSMSPTHITLNRFVNVTCSSDANPAATYSWYRNDRTLVSEDSQLIFTSIQSSDSGDYYCRAVNDLGLNSERVFINVHCE